MASAHDRKAARVTQAAAANGYHKVQENKGTGYVSYKNDAGTRVSYWTTTGTVGTAMHHPTKGATQLFRKGVSVEQVFENPRAHTGAGYYTKNPAATPAYLAQARANHHGGGGGAAAAAGGGYGGYSGGGGGGGGGSKSYYYPKANKAGSDVCYRCGGSGHWANSCPY